MSSDFCCLAFGASNIAAELLVDVTSLGRLTVEVCAGLTLFTGVALATSCWLVICVWTCRNSEEWLVDCETLSAFATVQVTAGTVTKNASVADTEADTFISTSKVEAVVKCTIFTVYGRSDVCTDVVTEV